MSSIGVNVDSRLSGLPDEILSHILSLMPTKFAVQTSILSKRWRYSWMFVTKLDFGDINTMDSVRSLEKIVDRVMGFSRPSQVELFRLHFPRICDPKPRVSDWIDKAVRLNIRELDLKVHQLQLPLSMFTCKSLTTLRLDQSGYDSRNVWEFNCPINLPCLKILDISIHSNPFVNAFKLISGCPMLESLSFEESKRHEDQQDYIFNIPTLKRLKLTWFFPSSPTHKVVIHLPNLEYLFLGTYCTSYVIMEDVSSLVEACISFNPLYVDQWVELLKGLCGVKSLSVEGYKAFDFKTASISALPIFPNVKYLELNWLEHSALVPHFLESSPELKHLCIETTYGVYSQPKDYSLVEPRLVPACMLTSLTTIKISVCESWRWDLPFLKYMLGNAEVLKTVTLIWKNSITEKEKLSCAELLMRLPRASRYCEIHYVGN